MLDSFSARLEARDPAKGHFRSYRVAAGVDLFGQWQVEICYGRIGTRGHVIRCVVATPTDAERLVKGALQRRSTAVRRIGTGYRFLELHDPEGWTD
jgi:hypothetical protein